MGLRSNIKRIQIGPVAIDSYSEDGLVDEIIEHAVSGTSTRQVVTVNAQFYVLAEHSAEFRDCLARAEYVCADGMAIVWACKLFTGLDIPRMTGVDLIERICERGATAGVRVFFLGGRPGAARKTADLLEERYPGIEVVCAISPERRFMRAESDREARIDLLAEIARVKPQILFLGLGAPKQEMFGDTYLRPLGIPIVMGVGGSFEILSGMMSRAPRWMQRSGLEWLYRLGQEPKRMWRRYLFGHSEFLWKLAKWRLDQVRGIERTKTAPSRTIERRKTPR